MIADEITRLVKPAPADKRLDAAGIPDAMRDKTGLTRRQAGIFTTEEVTAQTTDGLFTFTVIVVKV